MKFAIICATLLCAINVALSQRDQCPDTVKRCLKVFDHEPADLPKCYCTRLCNAKLDRLASNCASNELHADECGVCLKCARALGQTCGGFRNSRGVCAGGLVCKIRLPPTSIDRKKDEQQATGTCVREEDRECFRSTDTDEELIAKQLISCRPGLLGILAEALYCPDFSGRDECARTPIASQSQNNNDNRNNRNNNRNNNNEESQPQSKPTLLEVLLDATLPGGRRQQNNRN